ncbi:sperm-associated antigen 4 protein-like isoform X1 [Nyctibius grandis]|uniref:sperm-associated antigen 4 protein-like isoform X1 n=1 Tax=Nyctibius grandis TaxID=48427 RepID=UPI0035BC0A45
MVNVSSTPTAGSASQGTAKWCDKTTETGRTVFSLPCRLAGALVCLGRYLLSTHIFAVQKLALQRKTFLTVVVLLLLVVLAGVYSEASLPVSTRQTEGLREELTRVSVALKALCQGSRASLLSSPLLSMVRKGNPRKAGRAHVSPLLAQLRHFPEGMGHSLTTSDFLRRNLPEKVHLVVEEVARLKAELNSVKVEVLEANQAASEMASEDSVEMSDWAIKSTGATIDTQLTSETYNCEGSWLCRARWAFHTFNPPDTILQTDVSPGNCWPLRGQQGQVVIRLPARVHLTAVTVQHISKEVSSFGTVNSAPRDIAVFGVDADGEEETLLGTFMYDATKEPIQTFPLKKAQLRRAFARIRLVVKSNWGYPDYTCIYRVQVHGKRAKPESLN